MTSMRNLRCFVLLLSLYPAVAFLILLLVPPSQANAFWGSLFRRSPSIIEKLTKSSKALPDDEIIKLSKLSDEANGTVKVNKRLEKLKLPNDVLEDTFMRIAIHQGKIARTEAEGMFARLGRVIS